VEWGPLHCFLHIQHVTSGVGFGEVEGLDFLVSKVGCGRVVRSGKVVGSDRIVAGDKVIRDCRVIRGGRVVASGRNVSCHYPSRVLCFIPDFVLDVGLSKEVINSCLIKVETESLVNHLRFWNMAFDFELALVTNKILRLFNIVILRALVASHGRHDFTNPMAR
jgi:hypothetical protein